MASRWQTPVAGRPSYASSRDRKPSSDLSGDELPLGASQRTNRRITATQQPTRTLPQPKLTSNPPQLVHRRQPSAGDASEKSRGHYPARSWDSNGSATSGTSGVYAPLSQGPATSRLPGPGLTSRPRNVLRRKPSGLSQDMTGARNESQSNSNRTSSSLSNIPHSQTPLDTHGGRPIDRDTAQSPMELGTAQKFEVAHTTPHTATIYPELDRYRDMEPRAIAGSPGQDMLYKLATHDLPPPTPLFSGTSSQISGFSGSPSTRFSGSPGPGPYSRDTTPTSISSQSPGLVAPMRIPTAGTRMRPFDSTLTRPPITRRRGESIPNEADPVSADAQGLAAVRESLTSSSSNSTVRDGDKKDRKKKRERLPPPPPSPPPRKSSQKFKKTRDEGESPSKASREPAQPLMTSPPRVNAPSYSLPRPTRIAQSGTAAAERQTPPARPSRDGTPDLQDQLGRSIPVVQSNLSSTSLSDRRHSSLLASAPVGRPIFSSPPPGQKNTHSRHPSKDTSATQAPATLHKAEPARHTRTPSPSVSAFKSRFPIFGRRKTAPETSQVEKKEKAPRKGPAAGTGHEGYGRLGSVRRKSSGASTTGRFIPGTMSSQESLSSNQSSCDPYFLERTAPVIIAGGTIVENMNTATELSRTESNQSSAYRRPSVDSKDGSVSPLTKADSRFTLWPSPFPRDSVQAPSVKSRRPSDSSDSEALVMKSSLVFTRSSQRPSFGRQEARKIPKPILTRTQTDPPAITSHDTSIMSDDSMFGPASEAARVGKGSVSSATGHGPKKLLRRARSPIKWTFFSRSHSQPAAEDKKSKASKTVAANVKPIQTKPIAFYTMMDSSEQEDSESPDLEEVLREARELAASPQNALNRTGSPRTLSTSNQTAAHESAPLASNWLAPSAAKAPEMAGPAKPLTLSAPRVALPRDPTPAPRQAPGRPSRLPQVGRIPKVVSARPEQTSPKSFSRPFHRLSIQGPPPALAAQDLDFVAKGPSPPKPSTPELTQDESVTTSATNVSTTYCALEEMSLEPGPIVSEFLSFSPRKNSECTTTSSSSSGAVFAYADATALMPAPNAPLAEDEIWNEYNDFLADETVRLPPSGALPTRPSALDLSKAPVKRFDAPLESPTISPPPTQSLAQAIMGSRKFPVSSIYSTEMAAQVKEALGSAPNDQPQAASPKRSAPQAKRTSYQSVRQTRYSNSSGTSFGSDNSSPQAQVNLRVGSMTVSKWLTFGHVLFSPVRDELIPEVGSLQRPSIVVVDGLGNDDWSYYAADIYPAATFFNLSPRAPSPTSDRRSSSSAMLMSPPNHHQIRYSSLMEKFPFGPSSITAVVFRFPAAGPESHYRNIISEARRVLKPGGFIELSILDVDLNHMGTRGRRAVRHLKERIHERAPETFLMPVSDLLIRQLGRKGFDEIKSCRLGVPVANLVSRSSSSEAGAKRTSVGGTRRSGTHKDERSLPELINDDSSVADDCITKMVAKVGRWWYTRCYESAAASNPSMWNDKALLAECEEWGSSFKLMVCHARVPEDVRIRVASI